MGDCGAWRAWTGLEQFVRKAKRLDGTLATQARCVDCGHLERGGKNCSRSWRVVTAEEQVTSVEVHGKAQSD